MGSRSRLAALTLTLFAGAPIASAAEPGDASAVHAPAPRRRVVVLTTVGGTVDATLGDTIRELVARLDLELATPGPSVAADTVLAGVQIDLSSSADAVLSVTDGRTGEVRLRRSIPRDASSAIAREEIAHAVQSAVEAQMVTERDRAANPPPAPAPAPAPAPPPPPPPTPAPVVVQEPPPRTREEPIARATRPSPFALDLTTLAGVSPLAAGSGPNARVGGGVVAMWRAGIKPSIALDLTYAPPSDTGPAIVSSHASVVSLRAIPAVEVLHARWFALDVGAGAGFDVLTVAPRSEQLPPTSLGAQTSRVDPVLTAVATAHAAIAAGVVLLLAAGADVDFASRHYVLAQGTTDTDVLAPSRVRPTILLGFGFTALGEGHSTSGEAR